MANTPDNLRADLGAVNLIEVCSQNNITKFMRFYVTRVDSAGVHAEEIELHPQIVWVGSSPASGIVRLFGVLTGDRHFTLHRDSPLTSKTYHYLHECWVRDDLLAELTRQQQVATPTL